MFTHATVRGRAVAAAAGAILFGAVVASLWGRPAAADSNGGTQPGTVVTNRVSTTEPIPYPTVRKSSSEMREGSTKTTQAGVDGLKRVDFEVGLRNGAEISRVKVGEKVLRNPVQEIVLVGSGSAIPASRGRYASRGGFYSGRRTLRMIATGYDGSPSSNGGSSRSSTGLRIGRGMVAVDPRFIPIGTRLYIEGYGYAVAADVGGAIKGNRIDLGHDSARIANRVGRHEVIVHIVD